MILTSAWWVPSWTVSHRVQLYPSGVSLRSEYRYSLTLLWAPWGSLMLRDSLPTEPDLTAACLGTATLCAAFLLQQVRSRAEPVAYHPGTKKHGIVSAYTGKADHWLRTHGKLQASVFLSALNTSTVRRVSPQIAHDRV